MKDKNLPDDIQNKSLNELTELANNIIENLENKKDLESSISDYQMLIKLNNSKKFVPNSDDSKNFITKFFVNLSIAKEKNTKKKPTTLSIC